MPDQPTDLTALAERTLELANEATPGPWLYDGKWDVYADDDSLVVEVSEAGGNGKFVAESRTACPALAAGYLERGREIERLKQSGIDTPSPDIQWLVKRLREAVTTILLLCRQLPDDNDRRQKSIAWLVKNDLQGSPLREGGES